MSLPIGKADTPSSSSAQNRESTQSVVDGLGLERLSTEIPVADTVRYHSSNLKRWILYF